MYDTVKRFDKYIFSLAGDTSSRASQYLYKLSNPLHTFRVEA